jgi:hypothetical protein
MLPEPFNLSEEDIENIIMVPLMENFPILAPEKEMVTKIEVRKEPEPVIE